MSFFRETCFLLRGLDGFLFLRIKEAAVLELTMFGVLVVFDQDFILSVMVESTWRGPWFESERKLDDKTISCVLGHIESLEISRH
jgi:hypothetical protein